MDDSLVAQSVCQEFERRCPRYKKLSRRVTEQLQRMRALQQRNVSKTTKFSRRPKRPMRSGLSSRASGDADAAISQLPATLQLAQAAPVLVPASPRQPPPRSHSLDSRRRITSRLADLFTRRQTARRTPSPVSVYRCPTMSHHFSAPARSSPSGRLLPRSAHSRNKDSAASELWYALRNDVLTGCSTRRASSAMRSTGWEFRNDFGRDHPRSLRRPRERRASRPAALDAEARPAIVTCGDGR